ncbi:MAG: hypothetical protein PHQ98_00850 [Candidatus ainarchaeum sp.]|nr:hypothetical protein [Candidatus ainarchaeum sp.]
MKIYVGHSTSYDFKNELYTPLKKSNLNKVHELTFPHDNELELFNSKDFLKNNAELMIAEVSHPSFGLGIEMGWANLNNVKIICVYKTGIKISNALKAVSNTILNYSNGEELIKKLENELVK